MALYKGALIDYVMNQGPADILAPAGRIDIFLVAKNALECTESHTEFRNIFGIVKL